MKLFVATVMVMASAEDLDAGSLLQISRHLQEEEAGDAGVKDTLNEAFKLEHEMKKKMEDQQRAQIQAELADFEAHLNWASEKLADCHKKENDGFPFNECSASVKTDLQEIIAGEQQKIASAIAETQAIQAKTAARKVRLDECIAKNTDWNIFTECLSFSLLQQQPLDDVALPQVQKEQVQKEQEGCGTTCMLNQALELEHKMQKTLEDREKAKLDHALADYTAHLNFATKKLTDCHAANKDINPFNNCAKGTLEDLKQIIAGEQQKIAKASSKKQSIIKQTAARKAKLDKCIKENNDMNPFNGCSSLHLLQTEN